ncbi:MarR family winged helix-turn-helix transcriptional regulator [Prescottella subtropica]|uniref:MarR family winged helix-turn-helix transcriptional regulator n=1 Tax=Prescottella subtropica TaxID=2545757 RepID=UPI0010F7CF23|nr:MarR family winged helix-turn-helix transcriptional regulator [Prescottella subtropica]
MGSDPITELESELVDMWRRGRIQTRERARAINPKLDPACYPLLTILARGDAVPMSELVTDLAVEKSTLTRQIDAVVRLGLVERRPDPHDARARLVALTEPGRTQLTALRESTIAGWRERLSRWDPADVRQLTELLRRLAASTNRDDATDR